MASTATVYDIQRKAACASPRTVASSAQIPAGALDAVSRWTPQAAASRPSPWRPPKGPSMRALLAVLAPAGEMPPAARRARQRGRERGGPDLEARTHDR